MPTVWIPPLLRSLTNDHESIPVAGATLRAVIDTLDVKHPGLKARLCEGDQVRAGLSVVIDGQVNREGLSANVLEKSEVHFIPAIGGGQSSVARRP